MHTITSNSALVAIAIVCAMLLAACGGADNSSDVQDSGRDDTATGAVTDTDVGTDTAEDDEAAGAATDTDETSDTAEADEAAADGGVSEAQARYDEARNPLTFEAAGEPLDVASAAEGESVVILSISDGIPILDQWGTTIQGALEDYGVEVTRADAQGNPEQAASSMEQAISAGASAILLNAVPPDLIAPQIRDAQAAGIPVISTNDTAEPDVVADVEGVVVDVSYNYRIPARLMTDWFIADSDGQGTALSYLSEGQASSPIMERAIQEEIDELCPDCEITFEDVQIPAWFDGSLQNRARTSLAANPAITHMLPIYDAMTLAIDPAVVEAGSDAAIGSFNATLAVMQNLAGGSSALEMNVGCPNDWFSLAAADATFRLLAGMDAPTDYGIQCRIFDEDNIGQINPEVEDSSDWYGIDFAQEFGELWGPPSG